MTNLEKSATRQSSSLGNTKTRTPGPNNYDPPTVKSPTLLGPTDDEEGNQVHSRDQGLAMSLNFSNLPAGGTPDNTSVKVQAKWNGTLVGNIVTGKTPLSDDWANDKELVIPANHTNTPGMHTITYRVTFGLNGRDSGPTFIHVDNQPPVLATEVVYPAEIKADGFTAEYFEDVSPHALLSYVLTGGKTGDLFEFWIGDLGGDGQPTPDSALIETVELKFPREPLETRKLTRDLIKVNEGTVKLFAFATDRKGNRSLASPIVEIPVSMIPAPKDLALDIVLEEGVVDRAILFRDTQVPVHAELNYLNWQKDDKLRRTIDNQAAKVFDIPSEPPFEDQITYKELLGDGDLNLKEVSYSYQIQRGTKLIPKDPILKVLKVHLDKPGEQPDDPDDIGLPGSVDPKLPVVDVKGAFARDNYLIGLDKTLGATIRARMYKGFKKDDEIEVLAFGFPLPVRLKIVGDEDEDGHWEMKIDAGVIAGLENYKYSPFTYYIHHPGVNDSISRARPQLVDVHINEIEMPAPSFKVTGDPGNGDGETVYCDSLVRNPDNNEVSVEVTFAPDPKFADHEITFFIEGYENISDGGVNKPGKIIDNGFSTLIKTPTLEQATAGFSVYIPHNSFENIFNGWCKLSCTTKQDGYSTPSPATLFRVTMNHGDDTYCDLPPRVDK